MIWYLEDFSTANIIELGSQVLSSGKKNDAYLEIESQPMRRRCGIRLRMCATAVSDGRVFTIVTEQIVAIG